MGYEPGVMSLLGAPVPGVPCGPVSGGKWFLQEGNARLEHPVVNDSVVGVTGHVEHFDPRAQGGQPLGQLASVHLRHHNVSQKQVDPVSVSLGKLCGLGSICGGQHCVAVPLQSPGCQLPDRLFIFYQQNRLHPRS